LGGVRAVISGNKRKSIGVRQYQRLALGDDEDHDDVGSNHV
jgi:hypothetical protein